MESDNITGASESRTGDASSAVRRALFLPEILHMILSHLQPVDPDDDTCVDDDDSMEEYDDDSRLYDARVQAVATHRRALRAAALVNHLWFAIAIPLLWAWPSGEALHPDDFVEPRSRVSYARHIAKLRLTDCGPLWHALANDGHDGQDFRDMLWLPRLQILHENVTGSRYGALAEDVVPLLDYLSANIVELRFSLVPELLERFNVISVLSQASHHPYWLRKLMLVEADAGDDDDTDIEEQLLSWLAEDSSLVPSLASVELYDIFSRTSPDLGNRAFSHFALREGLERLVLCANATVLHRSVSNIPYDDIVSGGGDPFTTSHTTDKIQQRHGREPFKRLKELSIIISSRRLLRPLTLLLPSITSLKVCVLFDPDAEPSDIDDDEHLRSPSIFATLATLSQLRRLEVGLDEETHVSWEDMCALRSLTELRELCIDSGTCDGAANADIAALFRPLRSLKRLILDIEMPRLPTSALRFLGESLPQLRDLALCGAWHLVPSLDEAAEASPLFPTLRYFRLAIITRSIADPLDAANNFAFGGRAEAARQAGLLVINAPELRVFRYRGATIPFNEQIEDTFAMLKSDA